MSAARTAALTDIRARVIDQASHKQNGMRARACQRGTSALRRITGVSMVENRSAQRAPKRSADISMVRYGASQSTAQK